MTTGGLVTSFDARALEDILFGSGLSESKLSSSLDLVDDGALRVAFSGGLDSTALLIAMAEIAERRRIDMAALHVNHGLHPDADDWQQHCENMAGQLGVAFESGKVSVVNDGRGIEASARAARYSWLANHVEDKTVVLTAHHGFDQAETFFQRALRGGGAHALGAMRARAKVHGVDVVRPLLSFSRDALAEYVQAKKVSWIEDPANADDAFDRSWLRQTIFPALVSRWPGTRGSLAQAAEQSAEDAELLEELARIDLQSIMEINAPSVFAGDTAVSISGLRNLVPARQRNVLRYWIRGVDGIAPPRARLTTLLENLCADDIGAGCVNMASVDVHKFRGRLYLESTNNDAAKDGSDQLDGCGRDSLWDLTQPFNIASSRCVLVASRVRGQGIVCNEGEPVQVRSRHPEDRLRLAPGAPSRSLKNLYQENAIPPWQRSWLPVIGRSEDGQLMAIPGIGVDAASAAGADESGWVIRVERLLS